MSAFTDENLSSVDNIEQAETESLLNRQKINRLIGEIALGSINSVKKRQLEVQQDLISDFEARPYQIDAWLKLQESRQSGNDRGLINLATGLGKTTVATFDYAMFRKERLAEGRPAKGLFVVHQNNILKQAGNSFHDLMPDLDIKRYRSKNAGSLNTDFNLATFQSLTSGIENGSISEDEFDYIVYDEAHHIEADTYKKVVEHLKPTFQLGLTATPNRMDKKDITDHFGEALYTKTLPEAIVDNYLATVEYNLMIDEVVQQMIDDNFNPETMADINELFNYEPRNEEIIKNILSEQDKIKTSENVDNVKTIIFCSDKDHADEIAEMMNGASYHSGAKDQDNIMKSFRSGDINTITAVNMFNEGVDIPDTRMIVFLRTTQSPTVFEQQLGRGLRKTAGKDKVTVLDFVANIDRVAQINELKNEIAEIARIRNNSIGNEDIADTKDSFSHNANFLFDKKVTSLLEKYYGVLESRDNRVNLISYSNDELVVRWHEIMPGDMPTRKLLDTLGKESIFLGYNAICARFNDSLTDFQIACGYENLTLKTNDELVSLWHKIMPQVMPTTGLLRDLSKNGEFLSTTTIIKRFDDSIANFQEACGYIQTKDDIVLSWHEIMPGVKPTSKLIKDLNKQGKFIGYSALKTRLGADFLVFKKPVAMRKLKMIS